MYVDFVNIVVYKCGLLSVVVKVVQLSKFPGELLCFLVVKVRLEGGC